MNIKEVNEYIGSNSQKLLYLYLLTNEKTALKLLPSYGLKILIDNTLKDGDIRLLEMIRQ